MAHVSHYCPPASSDEGPALREPQTLVGHSHFQGHARYPPEQALSFRLGHLGDGLTCWEYVWQVTEVLVTILQETGSRSMDKSLHLLGAPLWDWPVGWRTPARP